MKWSEFTSAVFGNIKNIDIYFTYPNSVTRKYSVTSVSIIPKDVS